MGILYVEVFTLLICFTIINNSLFTVVINAESTEYVLDKLRTSVDNIQTTVDDVMSITEELNLLDNIERKLNLLETLIKHVYILSKNIISYVNFNYGKSFKEMKITALKINNLSSKIFTVIENIRLNPGSIPENSEVIIFSTEELITLIHHLNTLLLKEECQKSKYDSNKEPVKRKLDNSKRYDPNTDLEYETRKEGKRIRFKDTVTVYEYNEEAEISDASTTERKCTLNDETQGYCLKEEILSKDISHDVCKSSLQPSLKSCNSYEKLSFDSCVNLKDSEEEQFTLDTNEDGSCELTEGVKCASGTKHGAFCNLEGDIDSKAVTEKPVSNELLFSVGQCSSHEAGNDCPQKKQINPSEKFFLYESCTKKDIFYISDNKGECKNTELHVTDEASCNSHECREEFVAPSEDSSTFETHTIPSHVEESTATENNVIPDSLNISTDSGDSNENIKCEYSFAETAITTTEQPSTLDTFEYSEQSKTAEGYTTTETYTNSYDDSTTTESSPVHNDYGYPSDYTTTGETTTTESYSYSYDTFTTEQPSRYSSDSYTESTTTEQIETTTERDLSTLSQNIYSVAQDLSTKAQEISSVTSEISTKVSEVSSALSDISTDDQDTQNKIQELSKLTQEISSKTSEISTLSSETSRLASDISTASNDIPNVNNKDHPHRISPRQRITSKSQDLITSTQNIITAAQDVIVKIQDVSFRSYDLSKADMISTASHDITSRSQGIITEALDIVTAALEIMTSVDF